MSTVVGDEKLTSREDLIGLLFFYVQSDEDTFLKVDEVGSLSTVVGDEKLTSREDRIGLLFLYVQSDENTLSKVNKISKTEAQTFNIFDKLIGPLQFCI